MKLSECMENKIPYVIAEMSANHAGNLRNALNIIEAAKEAGADCLKIQTYHADTMTIACKREEFRIHGGLWDGRTLYELYEQAHTPWEWHKQIKEECEKAGLDFLSTPFDKSAVDFLEEVGVECYKTASFELVDLPLLEYIASKKKPIIMSCGLASKEEIAEALDAVARTGNPEVILLRCCSEYPANYSDMRLSVIPDMIKTFQRPVGLSDHSMGSLAALVAVSLGACVVEKHICLSRKLDSPDSAFSMEPEEFRQMVKAVKDARKIVGEPSYELTNMEKESLAFRRSIYAVEDIKKGEVFTEQNIRVIRPGYGMKPKYYKELLGRNAVMDIVRGTALKKEHVV